MLDVTRIRRFPGGGHLLFGLGHAQVWVLLVVIVLIVVAVYLSRRR